MIRRPPGSTQSSSSAASDVYKRQLSGCATPGQGGVGAPVAGGQVGCGLQATTQTNNTLSGAAIGAGVGALVGAAAGRGHVKNVAAGAAVGGLVGACLLYTSPSPRDRTRARMPSSA